MPYKMKNRFLILGLTGPVGSGCTQAARFLAGYPAFGKVISELLNEQTNEERFRNLNDRIKLGYKSIRSLKEKISHRKSKNFGPYWGAMIDESDDPYIKSLKRRLTRKHERLKIYLRRREVIEVLRDMVQDRSYLYENINENDKRLFGFNPFIYLSFTDIIAKLAVEAFKEKSGRDLFERYFADKISEAQDQAKSEFIALKDFFSSSFSIEEETWEQYASANKFISSRAYQIYLSDEKFFKKDLFLEEVPKIIGTYFNFIEHIKTSLKIANSGELAKIPKEYYFALSEVMQDWGDNIRATGNPFKLKLGVESVQIDQIYNLANQINILIKFLRFRIRFMDQDYKLVTPGGPEEILPTSFVLESFRNPFEVDFFRSRYSEFYLLSIYADKEKRIERINHFCFKRDERDQGIGKRTGEISKLDVRSCVLLSDVAILNNNGSGERDRKHFFNFIEKLMRYIAIIRSPGCIPPETDELYMHLAYSMSLMSTCISRKVGAVVVGPSGYIYGAGWNDVSEGQIGCGLRRVKDYKDIEFFPDLDSETTKRFENLLMKNGKYLCYKDAFSKVDFEKELECIQANPDISEAVFKRVNNEVNIKRLEYCRALHAEENAILQTAKVGGMPIVGGSIYTTTFPCELCAKKIYQTGIRTIYFTEPYPKSTSKVLLRDGNRVIEIRPFEGVKSNSFYKLFKPVFDKKDLETIRMSLAQSI